MRCSDGQVTFKRGAIGEVRRVEVCPLTIECGLVEVPTSAVFSWACPTTSASPTKTEAMEDLVRTISAHLRREHAGKTPTTTILGYGAEQVSR
jgi:hypothetical protein